MRHSVWAYPWDLHDLGCEDALAVIGQSGGTCISLATSYHAGRFLQPGNPKRRTYFPEDGTVYYKVDPARWASAEIAPKQAAIVEAEGDMLARTIKARDAGGAAVSCWTVCLHNSRLGMAHPAHALRDAFGDPAVYGLCPSSDAARDYVVGMVAEITHRYRPDRVELESPDFMGFDHGFHHEKDGLGLLPEDTFLLGLCFCDHCLARAGQAGIDGNAARKAVADHLTAAFARELPEAQFPEFPTTGLAAFDTVPALADYLRWRSEPVTSLIARIRAEAHPETEVLLIDAQATWQGGVDRAKAAAACDGLLYCAYFTPADKLGAELQTVREVLQPDATLIAGFQLFHPEVANADDLVARVCAASPYVDGMNFYNLGLVPRARLNWMHRAITTAATT
ncbi:hypothetical protein [Pseudoruegeria sp. SK021]|uniref:hypothetical protein n=1 Tax=Pseudoruegeria sp. SK021 TaxID=1933035 RepID=UPI000A2447BA|nr:hypothetical protein [Pseudoruegeria sp. SK021]OSP55895.1 hypothetical protein BV911_05355 [Pseudoruegeria sp. SK021]